ERTVKNMRIRLVSKSYTKASLVVLFLFFSSRRRHTRSKRDWSSDVCSSDLLDTSYSRQAIIEVSSVTTIASYPDASALLRKLFTISKSLLQYNENNFGAPPMAPPAGSPGGGQADHAIEGTPNTANAYVYPRVPSPSR